MMELLAVSQLSQGEWNFLFNLKRNIGPMNIYNLR